MFSCYLGLSSVECYIRVFVFCDYRTDRELQEGQGGGEEAKRE